MSPNDKLVASGSQDRTAKLWALADLSLLGVFRGHRRGVWCVQFSPMDQVLASSSADGSVRLWGLQDFSCLKVKGFCPCGPAEAPVSGPLRKLALCLADFRRARRLGAEGHLCQPWDAAADQVRLRAASAGPRASGALGEHGAPQLSLCPCSGTDGLIKLWTIKTNECIKTLDAHQSKVWGLHANAKSGLVVSGSADSDIILWTVSGPLAVVPFPSLRFSLSLWMTVLKLDLRVEDVTSGTLSPAGRHRGPAG